MLLDALEIAGLAPAALYGPTSTTLQHGLHFDVIERDCALAAEASRNLLEQGVGEFFLHRCDL
jgi:hypothetical protein